MKRNDFGIVCVHRATAYTITLISYDISDDFRDIKDMISILETNGVYTDKEIVHGILDMEEESFPIFARLATSDKYWKENHTNQDRWVHLCAIHL